MVDLTPLANDQLRSAEAEVDGVEGQQVARSDYGPERRAVRRSWSDASFRSSLVPMVLPDDERRYVAANSAACLLLRLPENEVLRLRIEDLASPASRALVGPLWDSSLREGTQKGTIELVMPDGALVQVEYSATANIRPGRHLAIWMFPPGVIDEPERKHSAPRRLLTARERQVLGMVAMGMGSS